MKEKILFVDDDPNILEAYQRKLRKVLPVDTAEGGHEGLRLIAERGPFAVVVADMYMPSMNGVEFLAQVKECAPDTVRMMLTGNADTNVAMQAVNEGNIFRFLTKPCPADVLGKALVEGIKQYRLVTAEREILEDTLNGAIELLAEILSWVDPQAFGRALEMRGRIKRIARKLRGAELWELELAAMLSQIGFISVPHDVVAKMGAGEALTDDEKNAVASVPAVGQELVARIPRLESVGRIVLYQDKHYDGSGFPDDAVAGEDIPLGSRILKVLKDLLELESTGAAKKDALSQMQARVGWYDSRILDATIALYVLPEKRVELEATAPAGKGVSKLEVGDVLVSGVRTLDNRLLIKAGEVVTLTLLIRIKNYAKLVGVQEPIPVERP